MCVDIYTSIYTYIYKNRTSGTAFTAIRFHVFFNQEYTTESVGRKNESLHICVETVMKVNEQSGKSAGLSGYH